MGKCPAEKRYKPLPLRRGFWREYLKQLEKGVALIPENFLEWEDVRNAAQAVIIDHIQSRLMVRFKRPIISDFREFFTRFNDEYVERIREVEIEVWDEICNETTEALLKRPDRDMSDKEAACLTYLFSGHPMPPDSTEFYMTMTIFARAYQELLQEKYLENYKPEIFYQALRQHMYKFIMSLLALDSAMAGLLVMGAAKDLTSGYNTIETHTVIDSQFLELDSNDAMSFTPEFVTRASDYAQEEKIKADASGRKEDRGCPALFAKRRDAIICFAIEELIAQHQIYTNNKLQARY